VYRTSHFEEFYDISLEVANCGSLEESFARFTAPQRLIGENQYDTDQGKQPAILETHFETVPPVLYLHLRRFRYDPVSGKLAKINDRFTFPTVYSLSGSNPYELFGVLVHSGTAEFGHYYAFLRPTPNPEWFEFNDSSVRAVPAYEAVDRNFGDGVNPSTAYMLIYLQKSSIPALFSAPDAPQLGFPLEPEEEEEDRERFQVRIITDRDLLQECGELNLETPHNSGIFYLPRLNCSKIDYVDRTAAFLDVSLSDLNIWSFSGDHLGVELIKRKADRSDRNFRPSAVFVRTDIKPVRPGEILVFLKFFTTTIDYVSSRVVPQEQTVDTLASDICALLDIPGPLFTFHQSGRLVFAGLRQDLSLADQGIRNGAILVFQRDPSLPHAGSPYQFGFTASAPRADVGIPGLDVVTCDVPRAEASLQGYIDRKYGMNKSVISSYEDPKKQLFVLSYATPCQVSHVIRKIAEHLNLEYDPAVDGIHLYGRAGLTDEPSQLPITSLTFSQPRMFFRLFPGTPQARLAEMTEVKVRIGKQPVKSVMLPRDGKVADVYTACELAPEEFFAFDLGFGVSMKILELTTRISEVYLLHFQRCVELTDDQKLVRVARPSRPEFFVPFFFVTNRGELFEDTKMRLQAELELEDEVFSMLQLDLQTRSLDFGPTKRVQLTDTSEIFELVNDRVQLFVQQPASRNSPPQTSLVIRH
jgi:ubiquitin carboxyl-terminal hydrolase 7